MSGSANRLNKNGSTSSSVSGPPKFNNKTPTLSSLAFRICEFQSMETDVVAFSNAVAAESTFLEEEEEEEEENARTSRFNPWRFFRPPRPSPSPFPSRRTTSSSSSGCRSPKKANVFRRLFSRSSSRFLPLRLRLLSLDCVKR